LAIGTTFLSGAEDALLYESVQLTGRTDDYTRLVGWANTTMLGATAVGNVASGLLATIDLVVPFLVAGVSLLAMLGIVLTLKEPRAEAKSGVKERSSYADILRQSIAIMRVRPSPRDAMLYLTVLPLAAVIMETFFLQCRAIRLGVPIAVAGSVVMALQMTNTPG